MFIQSHCCELDVSFKKSPFSPGMFQNITAYYHYYDSPLDHYYVEFWIISIKHIEYSWLNRYFDSLLILKKNILS